MISLKVSGCCNECREIDLELDHFWYGPQKVYTLHCAHEKVCGRLEEEQRAEILKSPQRLVDQEA